MASTSAIQATNDDASECKRCAVDLKYWHDVYLQHFIKNYDKKSPEINRGYFARVTGVNNLVNTFVKKCPKFQIINLGAGYDTMYWKLKDLNINVEKYVEIDYPAVTCKKCYTIRRNNNLLDPITLESGSDDVKFTDTELHSKVYHIVGVDLRNLKDLEYKLHQCGIDCSTPTLFLAECVLVYIEAAISQKILLWISSRFNDAVFINYEQVNMNDRFGQVMIKNLRDRGCLLAGVEACQSLDTHKQRFLNAGWSGARSWDMTQIYAAIPLSERRRIEAIEFLDEHEVLIQLLQHYAITIGWKGDQFKDIDII